MNRIILFMALALLGLLSACDVIITAPPNPVVPNPTLGISNVSYTTNYQADDGTYVVCDNRVTTLTYQFSYAGVLDRWTSYLEGETTGLTDSPQTFTPYSAGVSPLDGNVKGYRVQYVMDPYYAPYRLGSKTQKLSAQAIVVVPEPTLQVIGQTRLVVKLSGGGREATYTSNPAIPVVANCP